jgi:hypothetical protein
LIYIDTASLSFVGADTAAVSYKGGA